MTAHFDYPASPKHASTMLPTFTKTDYMSLNMHTKSATFRTPCNLNKTLPMNSNGWGKCILMTTTRRACVVVYSNLTTPECDI